MDKQPRPNDRKTSNESDARSLEAQLFAEILNRLDAQNGEQNAQPASSVRTIDLVELFYFLLSKLRFIILGAVIGALLLGFYGSLRSTPIYSATAKLYIMGETDISIITDLQVGTVLTMDYQEVFKTWEVHQMVNDMLGTNYSYSQMQAMVTVENPEDTRILYITVKNADPELAAEIANAYAMSAKRFITQTMDTDEPRTFSVALVPSVGSAVRITDWLIRGILLGTVLAGGILVLLFLLDNRPKSPDDIMQVADIPTLAVIPIEENSKKRSGGRKRKRESAKYI